MTPEIGDTQSHLTQSSLVPAYSTEDTFVKERVEPIIEPVPPSTQHPLIQQPSIQQHPVHQPQIQQPPVHQPQIQQTPVQQPSTHQPQIQQPPVQQPSIQRPPIQQPAIQQPSIQRPPIQQQSPPNEPPATKHQSPLQQRSPQPGPLSGQPPVWTNQCFQKDGYGPRPRPPPPGYGNNQRFYGPQEHRFRPPFAQQEWAYHEPPYQHGPPRHGPPHHGPPIHGPLHHGPPYHGPPHHRPPHHRPPFHGPPYFHGPPPAHERYDDYGYYEDQGYNVPPYEQHNYAEAPPPPPPLESQKYSDQSLHRDSAAELFSPEASGPPPPPGDIPEIASQSIRFPSGPARPPAPRLEGSLSHPPYGGPPPRAPGQDPAHRGPPPRLTTPPKRDDYGGSMQDSYIKKPTEPHSRSGHFGGRDNPDSYKHREQSGDHSEDERYNQRSHRDSPTISQHETHTSERKYEENKHEEPQLKEPRIKGPSLLRPGNFSYNGYKSIVCFFSYMVLTLVCKIMPWHDDT